MRCALLALGLLCGISRAQSQDPLVIGKDGKVTVNGSLTATQHIDATKGLTVNGSLKATEVINAEKGLKGLQPNQIPDGLDASKITSGTLSPDRIPGLEASRITSGILPVARGGTGSDTKDFVDTKNDQLIGGTKNFTGNVVTTGTINGEKPPLKFRIVVASNAGNYNTVLVDVRKLCGGGDGCRIKVMVNKSSDDNSPGVVAADVYMAPPDNNGLITGRTQGFTGRFVLNKPRTEGNIFNGSDWAGWFTVTNTYRHTDAFFSLGDSIDKDGWSELKGMGPRPFGDKEYQFSESGIGAPRQQSPYYLAFRFYPGVSGTVIIFDR